MKLTLLGFLLTTLVASAENETREVFRSTPDKSLSVGQLNLINVNTGELDINGATQLVTALLHSGPRDVFIIHTLVWRSVSDGNPGLVIDKQHWYALETGRRLCQEQSPLWIPEVLVPICSFERASRYDLHGQLYFARDS